MSYVFLLGAGTSIPAGLMGVTKLTTTFESRLDDSLRDAYLFIQQKLAKEFASVDIEHLLQFHGRVIILISISRELGY
jgi:hypothetical protein